MRHLVTLIEICMHLIRVNPGHICLNDSLTCGRCPKKLGPPVVTYSKISCHVHENNPEMDFESVRGFGHEANFHKRLF